MRSDQGHPDRTSTSGTGAPVAAAGERPGEVDRVALGRLIERLRLAHGKASKRQAALACNISESWWGSLERGFRSDGGPAELADGDALKIVWGLGLTTAEQQQLFTAAGFAHLLPRPVPSHGELRERLLDPQVIRGVLDGYSVEDLARLADQATRRLRSRLEDQDVGKPSEEPGKPGEVLDRKPPDEPPDHEDKEADR